MTIMNKPSMSQMVWGEQALAHARVLARTPRGSATPAEAQAARYVQEALARLGIKDVRMQPFRGLRSIWMFLALAFGMALVGHAAFWMLRITLGEWPSLVVSFGAFGMSGYMLWCKFTYRSYPMSDSLPHGTSQNVIGVIPPTGDVQRKVVLVSHLDSHRAVFWFAHDFLVKIYLLAVPLVMWGVLAAPLLYGLTVATHQVIFSWLALVLGIFHFVTWFSGVTADLGPYSPGANDNAAAVGTLLALAERLMKEPLEHTEVWLAFTGCEETGCEGMIPFLHEYGPVLEDALFIDLELVGIGDQLVYLQSEGVLHKRCISAQVENLMGEAGKEFNIKPMKAARMGVFTDNGPVWEKGFQGVTLLTMRRNSALLPEWHRLTDIAERLKPEALRCMGELVWFLIDKQERP
jgi:hypothetical protein